VGIASTAKVEETTTADLAVSPIAVTVEEQFAVVVDIMPAQAEVGLQHRAAAYLSLVVAADIPVQSTPLDLMAAAVDNRAADMAAAVADTGKLV
jgi:hypothetical protein